MACSDKTGFSARNLACQGISFRQKINLNENAYSNDFSTKILNLNVTKISFTEQEKQLIN